MDAAASPTGNGPDLISVGGVNNGGTYAGDPFNIYSATVPFHYGDNFGLVISIGLSASALGGDGHDPNNPSLITSVTSATFDLSHSLYWAGISNVTANGNPVTNFTAMSPNGVNYANSFAPQPCDVNQDGTTNVIDAQDVVNEALGSASPANDLNGDGVVNVVDIQIDINAVLKLGCKISTPTPAVVTESKNRTRLNPATYNRALVSTAPAQLASASLPVEAPQPLITSVVSAASFQDGPVAPGELVSLSVTGLGPVTPAGFTLDRAGDIATSLEGVEVLFNGRSAPLTYVSATQITCVVPYEIRDAASPHVQVSSHGQISKPFLLTSAPTVPALFTADGSGSGPAAAFNQDGSPNSPTNPAERGSKVVLYVTGEGQTSPTGVTGKVTARSPSLPLTPQPVLPVRVIIGGQSAAIVFYGETPGVFSGVMQLDAQIPSNVPPGDLPVSVSVGGNGSQSGVTVSVRE